MKYRSKPKVVEAMQLTQEYLKEFIAFIGDDYGGHTINGDKLEYVCFADKRIYVGEFIIKNDYRIYCIDKEEFLKKYEAVDETNE